MKKEWIFSRIVLFTLVIVLILSLSACEPKRGDLPENIHKGTQGIEMRFLPNNPPNKITASTGMPVNFAIEIKNKGASPLRGYLYLSGFAREVLSLPDLYVFPDPVNCGVNNIAPKTKYYTQGGTCVEHIPALLNLNYVQDEIEFPIMATAIYPYATDASIMVCIDPNYHQLGKKACQMRPVTVSGGQGAPIAITKVEPIPIGKSKVQFNVYLKNVGGGDIVDYTRTKDNLRTGRDFDIVAYAISVPISTGGITTRAIEDILVRGDKFYVAYGDNYLNIGIGGNFNTAASGIVRFYDGHAVISRIVDFGSKPFEFVTPLRVTLFYGYMEDIRTSLKINKIPDQDMELLFPSLGGFYTSQLGTAIMYQNKRYAGAFYEDPYGHDVWRFMDKEKNIDVIFTTT